MEEKWENIFQICTSVYGGRLYKIKRNEHIQKVMTENKKKSLIWINAR